MKTKMLGIIAMGALLAACGSISRGTKESVVIAALPNDAKVTTSLGHSCPQSPCTIQVDRKAKFTVFAEKPGYKPGRVEVTTKVSGEGATGFAGNIILGGVIGMGVDAATGAALDHIPNPAYVVLEPIDPKNPSTPVMKPILNPPKVDPKTKKAAVPSA